MIVAPHRLSSLPLIPRPSGLGCRPKITLEIYGNFAHGAKDRCLPQVSRFFQLPIKARARTGSRALMLVQPLSLHRPFTGGDVSTSS